MSSELKVEDLERSLNQRANELADEYIQRAKRSHAHMIEDENERLQLREEKEVMAAKMAADRHYRSRVQSSELEAQKKLDQLRWDLIKNVTLAVKQHLKGLVADTASYEKVLIPLIHESAKVLDIGGIVNPEGNKKLISGKETAEQQEKIIIELNQDDYEYFKDYWERVLEPWQGHKTLELSEHCHSFSGGAIVYNQSRTCRIDNSFEGRMERLQESIYQKVAEQFFSELTHEGDKIHGR